jgi:hypothetical protein
LIHFLRSLILNIKYNIFLGSRSDRHYVTYNILG